MIVYLDRTFCAASDCKFYPECPRVMTEEEEAGLSPDMPVSYIMGCEKKELKKEEESDR